MLVWSAFMPVFSVSSLLLLLVGVVWALLSLYFFMDRIAMLHLRNSVHNFRTGSQLQRVFSWTTTRQKFAVWLLLWINWGCPEMWQRCFSMFGSSLGAFSLGNPDLSRLYIPSGLVQPEIPQECVSIYSMCYKALDLFYPSVVASVLCCSVLRKQQWSWWCYQN